MPFSPAAPQVRRSRRTAVALITLTATGVLAPQADAQKTRERAVTVRSTPENLVLGGFPIDRAPIATVKPGQLVKVDTIAAVGATSPAVDPVTYFAQFGIPADEVLPDMIEFWKTLPNRPNYGVHPVTGPIDVEGAEPGDTLEIQIVDVEPRVSYGVNFTAPDSGTFSSTYPGFRPGDQPLVIPPAPADAVGGIAPDVRQHLYKIITRKGKRYLKFDDKIKVPLEPFMGVMAVKSARGEFVGRTENAPAPALGVQDSVPPGSFGGNLDVRDLKAGSSLFLPVEQAGAGFYTGDAHAAQGNGEVSGTAAEHSMTGTFRFIVHKRPSNGPFAKDKRNYIAMGISFDLDRALKLAVGNMVGFLQSHSELSVAKAYSLASLAGDFQVGENVDRTQVITGKISRKLLSGKN